METDRNETAIDRKVTRRWVLRSTVGVTVGVAAIGTLNLAGAEKTPTDTTSASDHDPATGEIFDRDRHHHWDTV
jgi:hypothetical protein